MNTQGVDMATNLRDSELARRILLATLALLGAVLCVVGWLRWAT